MTVAPSRMLNKSLFSPARPRRAETRLFPRGVLASLRGSTYRCVRLRLFACCGLAGRHFEHPAGVFSSCQKHFCHCCSAVPKWYFRSLPDSYSSTFDWYRDYLKPDSANAKRGTDAELSSCRLIRFSANGSPGLSPSNPTSHPTAARYPLSLTSF